MSENVIVALLSLVGTLVGTLSGILVSSRLVNYRLEQLENKVDKHNDVIERTFVLETHVTNLKKDVDRIIRKG